MNRELIQMEEPDMDTAEFKETIPVAPLKIITLDGFRPLAEKINKLIVDARHAQVRNQKSFLSFIGYEADTYIVDSECSRFGSGEAKAVLSDSIQGSDLYILADVTNSSKAYQLGGINSIMSPDDHFQDLKRIIDACNGKAHRINIIIPYLYEGRQHISNGLESLDCATSLQELANMGVKNIITFDAHDPRVQNAVPIEGFDNFYTSYQFIQAILATEKGLQLDSDHLMIISPDEGGMTRAVFYANNLGVDIGMFYIRRDYSVVVDGTNPVVAYEFLGTSVEGKTVFIIDDIISTGERILEVAAELKKRKAAKIYLLATFGLFTEGYDKFDEYYKAGIIDRLFTTNLTYCQPELLKRPYYTNVDFSRYIALIIDTINHDKSIDGILNSTNRIQDILSDYKNDLGF
jgi:ribose-phosphate pyrophosphokinase